ncbi:hypothetical protein T484DRAFT_1658891 [Baffinella frigidus]|nr:hypothetical protein T484DRAFT_1658891 [Cryptophyta sp. CCMP2293]
MAAPLPVNKVDAVTAEGFSSVPVTEALDAVPSASPEGGIKGGAVGEGTGAVLGAEQVLRVAPASDGLAGVAVGDQGVKAVHSEAFGGVGGPDNMMSQAVAIAHTVDESAAFGAAADASLRLRSPAAEKACRCGKTKCLKQYCSCFRIDSRCTAECKCSECFNDGNHEEERIKAVRLIRLNDPMAFKGTTLELEGFKTSRGTVKTVRGCRCRRARASRGGR